MYPSMGQTVATVGPLMWGNGIGIGERVQLHIAALVCTGGVAATLQQNICAAELFTDLFPASCLKWPWDNLQWWNAKVQKDEVLISLGHCLETQVIRSLVEVLKLQWLVFFRLAGVCINSLPPSFLGTYVKFSSETFWGRIQIPHQNTLL